MSSVLVGLGAKTWSQISAPLSFCPIPLTEKTNGSKEHQNMAWTEHQRQGSGTLQPPGDSP